MKKKETPQNLWSRLWVRRTFLVCADALCVFAAFFATLVFRFGGLVPDHYMAAFWGAILYIVCIYIFINALFRLYSTLWEHAGVDELVSVICATFLSTVLCYIIALIRMERMPRSIYIAAGCIVVLLHGGLRLFGRVFQRFSFTGKENGMQKRALIVGAGETGALIAGQMRNNRQMGFLPVCLVDDDPLKQGQRIHGVRVRGTSQDIPALVKRLHVDTIVYAIPSANAQARKRILELCAATGCFLKMVPAMESYLEDAQMHRIRDVEACDLLDRPVVRLDAESVRGYLRSASVLVTGGGGSIGAELCRQIARFAPAQLVIFDICENNAYELYMELQAQYGTKLCVDVEIGSVCNKARLDQVFAQYKPSVVFHAAAYKHVPLMEANPAEAVQNNVGGTWQAAKAADESGVKRFILVSTDKAVNPANVLGATKYLCEMIMQYMNKRSANTHYTAVRLGNVLDSHGSVLPLFRRQIAAGGPVTVTHKDVMRYFMTIPEAAQLLMQAGSMAERGSLFLLDMGEPIRIDDFARSLIRLSGFEPDADIPIVYTGLRPGEKMCEEPLGRDEVKEESGFPGIWIGKASVLDAAEIERRLDYILRKAVEDPSAIRCCLAEVVPTYHAAQTQR